MMNDVAAESVAESGGQETAPLPAPPLPPASLVSPAADVSGFCPRCHADLTRHGRAARFCPRCGASRQQTENAVETVPPETLTEAASEAASEAAADSPAAGDEAPVDFDVLASLESAPAAPIAPAAPAAKPPPLPALAITEHTAAWMRLRSTPPAVPVPRHDDSHSLMLIGYANAMYRLGYRYETGLGNNRNPDEAIRCYFKAAKLGNAAALARLAPACAAPACAAPPALPAPNPPQG